MYGFAKLGAVFFFDPLFLLVFGAGALLSFGAGALTKSRFKKYSQLPTRSGLSGAQIARAILNEHGIAGVKIERVAGELSDHYDPGAKTLRLSETVHDGRSMAAFGVAAHEVGHAIQHHEGYAALRFRSAWVPVANIGSNLSTWVLMAAAVLGGVGTALGETVAWLGIMLFGATTLFTLVTLPVEFDASRRALACLEGRFVSAQEYAGAAKVLNAAALTYLAAFAASLMMLVYWAYRLGLLNRR